ncbi:hypothetical protein CsSME_00004735 [Camellia sinensis var. sinensis]
MMSVAALGVLAALHGPPTTGVLKPKPKVSATDRRSILWTEQKTRDGSEKGRLEKKAHAHAHAQQPSKGLEEVKLGLSIQDYLERSKHMIRSDDGGPPRWFSPLEEDTTDLVKLVEGTVRSENNRSPNRPIDLVEESIGGCLALAVAAQNPDVDLMLILSNPATCFKKSPLQLLTTYLEIMPEQLHLSAPYMLCLVTGFLSFIVMISTVKGGRLTTCQFSLVQSFGIPLTMAMATVKKGFSLQKRVGELSYGLMALSSYLYVRFNFCM